MNFVFVWFDVFYLYCFSDSKLWLNLLDFESDIINNTDGLTDCLIAIGRRLTADAITQWAERLFVSVPLSLLVSVADSRYRFVTSQSLFM